MDTKMRILSLVLDALAATIGFPALAVTVIGLADREITPIWLGLFALAVATALFAAATPGRGRGWSAGAAACLLTAFLPMALGVAFVWFGPSSDSGSWASVIHGWTNVAYGVSFVALGFTTLLRSRASLPAGLALAATTVLGLGAIAAMDQGPPLLVIDIGGRDENITGLAVIGGGMLFQLLALGAALAAPGSGRRLRASGRTVASTCLAIQGSAAAWLAYLGVGDEARGSDAAAIQRSFAALAVALVAASLVTGFSGSTLPRALVRVPVFAAASAAAFLLGFDARFPFSEAMLLLAGAAVIYAHVIAHPRRRRVLPAIEVLALPLAALVLFTEVPGFGLALTVAATVAATERFGAGAGPRGRAGARA